MDGDDDIDLSGVHPGQWKRTRARVAAVREYIGLSDPTDEDERVFAERLNVSVAHFKTLVRVWRQHQSASALPGAGAVAKGHPGRRHRLSRDVRHILGKAIVDIGPNTQAAVVHAEVSRRCRAAGLEPPHSNTTIAYLRRAKRAAIDAASAGLGEPNLIIDHCAAVLPVQTDDGVVLPVISLAISVPARKILAHHVQLSGPTPATAATVLRKALEAPVANQELKKLKMNSAYAPSWRPLEHLVRDAGIQLQGTRGPQVPSGRDIGLLIGRFLGQIRLRPNFTHRNTRLPKITTRRPIDILTLADVETAVAHGVKAHNDSLPHTVRERCHSASEAMIKRRQRLLDAVRTFLDQFASEFGGS